MKVFVQKHGLILSLVLALTLVFVGGGFYSRYMTAQIDVHANSGANAELLAMVPGATSIEAFATTAVAKTFALVDGRGDYDPSLLGSYRVYQGADEVAVVYVVRSFGRDEKLDIAYAFDLDTDEVLAVKVIANGETPYVFATLGASFYAQFPGMALDDVALAVDAVAGATYSSKGFEIALLYAREQYAADYGFQIPTIVMTLNHVGYNLDPATFLEKPFIADVTYGEDDTNVVVYLDLTYAYAGLVSGTEPADDVKAAISTFAAAAGTVYPNVRFAAFDDEANELVIVARGYNAQSIAVTFTLNDTLDAVLSYEVDSHESYDNEYNDKFDHDLGEVPYTEETMIEQLIDGVPIDSVVGASVTSAAMQKMLALLGQFLDANGGGE